MTTPTHPPSLIRRDATEAELAYLTLRRDFLDSLRDQHRALRNRKEMTEERRSDILETLRNLASQTEDIKMAGLRMKDEQPLCRSVCENRIGYFNGGLSSAFAWDCNKNRDEIVRLINAVAWEGNSGVLFDKVDGQLVWR